MVAAATLGAGSRAWTSSPADFVLSAPRPSAGTATCASMFSGAGIGDYGYGLSGFKVVALAEADEKRAAIACENSPFGCMVVGDVRERATVRSFVSSVQRAAPRGLDLLTITPPCQGMSSVNPGRGKVSNPRHGSRDARNLLLLAAVPALRALRPRVVVVENVPQALRRMILVRRGAHGVPLVSAFLGRLDGYQSFSNVVQMADYGVPQTRRRSVVVLIREDLDIAEALRAGGLAPWPRPTHGTPSRPWITFERWHRRLRYPSLDGAASASARDPEDELHCVPAYTADRYTWVSSIPPRSGRSAYANGSCASCGNRGVPAGLARCNRCLSFMRNRPHTIAAGRLRRIRGFESSYRRMRHDAAAPTVSTASGFLGSDYKIHPWENRVLSARECADLQTVPRSFQWQYALGSGTSLVRQVVGEAMPAWFTFLHGKLLLALLGGRLGRLACAPHVAS